MPSASGWISILAQQFPTHSRVQLRRAVNAATIEVDGQRAKAAHRLRLGERISVRLAADRRAKPRSRKISRSISSTKTNGWRRSTSRRAWSCIRPRGIGPARLTSALQFHFDQLSGAGGPTRPGIVHRLDRDTSGVMVVAKTDQIHFALSEQFEQRTVEKEYFAIVSGNPDRDRDLDRSADRHASLSARKDGHPPRPSDQPPGADVL